MNENGNNRREKSTSPLSPRPSTNQEAVAENSGSSLNLTADSQQQGSGITDGRGNSVSGSPTSGVSMERTMACRGYSYHEHLSSAARPLQQCSCGFTPRRISTGGMAMGGVSMERTQGCRGYSYHRRYTDCPCGRE
ncbi:uncharacterized protein Bfra_002596 [Botrytis fragariae]|uniref:Uncharacterized protein n=1 Tax=Botrytis fragariae TaxID=1964551 RepID=A0A8H6EL43_9HELO|nr:uncharacterized protein Bfra_002596 [Botrytis fragariae]KAF5876194.1 hypothetical protein Bfra_002596 [Botrytis fragariae]